MSDPLYDIPSSPIQSPLLSENTLSPEPAVQSLGDNDEHQVASDTSTFQTAPASHNIQEVSNASLVTRKRRMEDMTQFAEATARNVKLCPANRQAILDFAQLAETEQMIALNANVLKILERQNELLPPEAAYKISNSITAFIDAEAARLIMSPDLSAYIDKDEPVRLLEEKLKKKAVWNIPQLKDDKSKWDVIVKYSRNKLNNGRHLLKKTIGESLPEIEDGANSDIVPECDDIIQLCEKILRTITPGRGTKTKTMDPSVEMLARVSFLRHCYVQFAKTKQNDNAYWKLVDAELVAIRKKHNNDVKKISKVFARILEKDQELYGCVSLTAQSAQSNSIEDS
ncbi:hypothetical protein BKA93DRAFT_931391 [Sparassis latifolia]